MELEMLNEKYNKLDYKGRLSRLFEDFSSGEILFTSSFGATSGILLHLFNKVRPSHPVYIIDTGYLFRETHNYIEAIKELWGLNVEYIEPEDNQHKFTLRNKTYKSNQDLCCELNKVIPLNKVKSKYKVWVSGLLAFQNSNRESKNLFEEKNGIIKFYPIIDLSEDLVNSYMVINEIPQHPLVELGYSSIGCTHCTKKGEGREGRWSNIDKVECGIHV